MKRPIHDVQGRLCGCCEGTQQLTPEPIANRPGLDALAYRMGTQAAFLETMKARLSDFYLEIQQDDLDAEGKPKTTRVYPLRGLTTRAAEDPSIALLDAWATLADVLTFYQERIANEGYLRTATERRSILELARLVGYALRPGVASTVYLAYTLDDNAKEPVVIPVGARAQSVPGPGELPQSFETVEKLEARAEWNNLKPRLTQPQTITSLTDTIYLAGVATNLKANDPILIDFGNERKLCFVQSVEDDAEAKRTKVVFTTRGAIDPELGSLQRLVQDDEIPEEEGPYSLVIGARAAGEIQQEILRLMLLLQDESQLVGDLIHEINVEMSRIQQTSRILKALNFEILETWVKGVYRQLESIRLKLRLRPSSVDVSPAGPISLDIDKVQGLLSTSPTSRKPFGKEIGAEEVSRTKMSMQQLCETLKNKQISDADKVAVARGELVRLGQLVYVFRTLGFTSLTTWVQSLYDLLASALPTSATGAGEGEKPPGKAKPLEHLIKPLLKMPALHPVNALRLERKASEIFSTKTDAAPQIMVNLSPRLKASFYQAWRSTPLVKPGSPRVYALRTTASVFGYNAPRKLIPVANDDDNTKVEMPVILKPEGEWKPSEESSESGKIVFLDNSYDKLLPGSFIVIQRPGGNPQIFAVEQATMRPRTAYGVSGKTTEVHISGSWWQPGQGGNDAEKFEIVRGTVIYAQSEELVLAEESIETPLGPNPIDPEAATLIELGDLYDGLISGQWLIISGERVDIPGASGVQDAELVTLARVEQGINPNLPSDTTHTTLILANGGLSFNYKRDTVKIYGNVVKATHGETRNEVLGSGDGSQAFQSFVLKQPPLTFVAAPTPAGAESTLHVRVNDVEWHETDSLAGLGPTGRNFITRTDDESKTTVIFGNGQRGVRPPTGVENIKAVYRNGIGKPGNVRAEQISLLVTRPLDVKEVINPMRASGGADKESRDQARKHAPLAVLALDRLVSTQDYADFARTFAGIGKASASRLTDGRHQLVHVTIAGADDIPIEKSSDLYQNLVKALRKSGDPYLPIMVEIRELMLIVLSTNIRILPDYQWESVVTKIRASLLDTFSFERQELGQDVLLSEIIRTIQSVEGVAYVDVDMIGGVSEKDEAGEIRTPDEIAEEVQQMIENQKETPEPRIQVKMARVKDSTIHPAQLAFLTPDVEATLILNEVKS
jgi:hypothetical protein